MYAKSFAVAAIAATVAASPAPAHEIVQIREIAARQNLGDLNSLVGSLIPSASVDLGKLSSLAASLAPTAIPTAVPTDLAQLSSLASLLPTGVDLSSLAAQIPTASVDISSLVASLIPSACIPPSSLLSVLSGIPTPAPTLEAALESLTTITDPCATPSFTGALSSQYVSYSSALESWYSKNSAAIESYESKVATACPLISAAPTATNLSGLGSPLNSGLPSCLAKQASGKGAAKSTGASGYTNAAPQATAFAAAGFVAGLAGVVAAL